MSKFDAYFLMDCEDVIAYVKEKLDAFHVDDVLTCTEIGDGNLNYVFRVKNVDGQNSVIVKQAGHTARISDDFRLSTNRIRIETEALLLQGSFAPGLVPVVYLFDEAMSCCVMEDLSDYTIMRTALLEHRIFPRFAEEISTFMANTLLCTTDVVMDHKEKKEKMVRFINPELCEISEDLVYSEPFNDYNGRNIVTPGNEEWVTAHIYGDEELKREAAKLKFDFMTKSQALIHGDLHTGSIFIDENGMKVIDPEFAFYGPMGYDVGNMIANLLFGWANGYATGHTAFTAWIESCIADMIDLFVEKSSIIWEEQATEVMARQPGFKEWYLRGVMQDSAGVAGLEIIRRIVGLAQVKDITSIPDPDMRIRVERICMTIAIRLIKEREDLFTGEDFMKIVKEAKLEGSKCMKN